MVLFCYISLSGRLVVQSLYLRYEYRAFTMYDLEEGEQVRKKDNGSCVRGPGKANDAFESSVAEIPGDER